MTTNQKNRKAFGHESVLLAVLRNHKRVEFKLQNGETIIGYVKAYDPFTISVENEDGSGTTVYFKHALLGFKAL